MKMLVVDDDLEGRRALSRLFYCLEHQVVESGGEGDAFSRVLRDEYDLVLGEVRMPEVSGS